MPIYLDHNASAPLCPAAAATMTRVLAAVGNASSIHRYGQAAKALLDDARDAVAALIGGDPSEIVFTSGGSESDNLALRGAAASGRRGMVVSAVEHEAVLHTARALARDGWRTTVVPCDGDGLVDPDRWREAIDDDTAIVSLMLANNETGVIEPVAACARLARERGALVHTDAVQAAGKMPIDVGALGVDMLTLSAHKFGGPQGAGVLWVRRGLTLTPQIAGGRQERGRRAGTENVAAIAATGAAAAEARRTLSIAAVRMGELRDRLERGLLDAVPGCAVNGCREHRVPNTTNISFDGVEGESLVIALDLDGIAVSTGSACASGTLEPSHVLRAMHLPASRVQSAVRISLGPGTTDDDIQAVLDAVPRRVARLRHLAGGRR
ncbi:MAG: cysteine desulfurase family protein [Vicinamibacterales bacterium]|nr:cysteine desulfurase family protein [Vicinamibacterales bacterium]